MNTLPESHYRPLFPRGPSLGLRTFLLITAAIALIFYDTHGESLRGVRNALNIAATPLVWLATITDDAATVSDHFVSRKTLERENAELRRRQLELDVRLQRMDALEAENRRIRELLSSATHIDDRVLIAEILSINQDPYRNQITLNKGSRDAVYKGQALVDAYGVLGQVIAVTRNRCTALMITDPDHGIMVEVNRTGMQTVAVGAGDRLGLRLPFLPSNADIQVGDLLVSSSLGGRFPSGYPVGKVYEVRHVAGEHFMEAYAAPAARLNQGRQALLVWSENYSESNGEADSTDAGAAPGDADASSQTDASDNSGPAASGGDGAQP